MKEFAILLFTASSLLAQPFGNNDGSEDWLPVPDGFVWPKPEKAPVFKPEWKKFSDPSEARRTTIMRHWPEENSPEHIQVAEVDLNKDGKPELFFGVPALSGTGGTFYEILSPKTGENYTRVGSIQGSGIQIVARKDGWFQIEGMSRGGGGNYTRYLMTFGSGRYEITRNERHDFNRSEVTIRKTQAERSGAADPAGTGRE